MVIGSYIPRWVTVKEGDLDRRALAFVINMTHPMYAGRLPRSEVVRILSTAEGSIGKACDYLYRIVAELETFGIRDSGLTSIARDVQSRQQDRCENM